MPCNRSVRLERWETRRVPLGDGKHAFRLRIVATSSCGDVPLEIFLHKNELTDAKTGKQARNFIGVCGPLDLVSYPTGEPTLASGLKPFYRLASVDVLVASSEQAAADWEAIQQEVKTLCEALCRLDVLVHKETVEVGGSCDESSLSASVSEPAP